MSEHSRFGIYYLPPKGPIAEFGAQWLGWDIELGHVCDRPYVAGIEDVTLAARKYGFHGTLMPPFRLAEGATREALEAAADGIAKRHPPIRLSGLELSVIGGFLALTPVGDAPALQGLAHDMVAELDRLRAAPTPAELARRRAAGLTPSQEANLLRWGYPYVMDEFRFHMTLTGKLTGARRLFAETAIRERLPELPRPFDMAEIALVGERTDGMFQTLHRYALTGRSA